MIPDEAIEAAHAAICEQNLDDCLDPDWRGKCVKAVEAAVPHLMAHVEGCESGRYGDACPCHCHEMKRSNLMTPDQAERLRDLFWEARKTTRDASQSHTAKAYAADDAAVEAFNTALREYTR